MDKKCFGRNIIKQIMEGRAARVCAVAVTAFLCVLSLIEFTALELELEIPVLEVICGEHSIWSESYQQEELALDYSRENELLEENTGTSSKSNVTKDAEAAGKTKKADDAEKDVKVTGEIPKAGTTEKADTAEKGDTEGKANQIEKGKQSPKADLAENVKDVQTTEEEEIELPYYIRVNRKQNCITIYTQDKSGSYTVPYKAMICSTGLYNATPRGTYQISTKYLWRDLYGGVYGQYATRIHGGILFHSVPYYKKSKNSLCTDKYNKLGQQASMGCVRLTVEDAKWIAENCPAGTTVEIYDDDDPGPLGKPEPIKIDTDSPNKGWDPTDPDTANPWNEVSEDE